MLRGPLGTAEKYLKLLVSATNPLRNLHGSLVWILSFWGVRAMFGYVGLFVRLRGPVATPRLFQGFACSCYGLQGVVLRGGFILGFVVLMLVIQGGGFILWFEGGDAGL